MSIGRQSVLRDCTTMSEGLSPKTGLVKWKGVVVLHVVCCVVCVWLRQCSWRRAWHITCTSNPHFQLNKKREMEGQIADLKTDLAPLDKQLEDMLATSRKHTNTLLWLGTYVCTCIIVHLC